MEVRAQQVLFGIAEAIAAHNLLRYVRTNGDEEMVRMAAGATMAGLGYVFGPDLEQRIRTLNDAQLSEQVKQRMIYAAGGIVLGGITGYHIGAKIPEEQSARDIVTVAQTSVASPQEQPGGLLVIASAGWLGYSLFFDGKTPEEQQRHLWGLGAGVVGYMYGPELLKKLNGFSVPAASYDESVRIYSRGGAVLGGIAGGILGWKKGEQLFGGAK